MEALKISFSIYKRSLAKQYEDTLLVENSWKQNDLTQAFQTDHLPF